MALGNIWAYGLARYGRMRSSLLVRIGGLALATGVGVLAGVGVAGAPPERVFEAPSYGYSVPPCPTEDSPGPCFWDAATMGNGRGRSFVVGVDQVVRYADGKVAAR